MGEITPAPHQSTTFFASFFFGAARGSSGLIPTAYSFAPNASQCVLLRNDAKRRDPVFATAAAIVTGFTIGDIALMQWLCMRASCVYCARTIYTGSYWSAPSYDQAETTGYPSSSRFIVQHNLPQFLREPIAARAIFHKERRRGQGKNARVLAFAPLANPFPHRLTCRRGIQLP